MKIAVSHVVAFSLVCIPPVHAECYDDASLYASKICGELEIKGKESSIKVTGKAEAEANVIVKKFIGVNGSGTIEAGESEYVGVARDELLRDRFDARGCRERMFSKISDQRCEKKQTYNTCARPEFGLLRYNNEAEGKENSGWRGGGHTRGQWCSELAGAVIARNGITGDHNTIFVRDDESRRKRGFGHAEYNYYCEVKVQYNPIYNAKKDPLCGAVVSR